MDRRDQALACIKHGLMTAPDRDLMWHFYKRARTTDLERDWQVVFTLIAERMEVLCHE